MKGKKFNAILTGASALGALAGMIFMGAQMDRALGTPGERALWVGGFFLMLFVFGFLALQLGMLLNRKYMVERNPRWWLAFLLAGVLLFGVGVGGQYLFMYSRESYYNAAEVDMVLLLDASGSMETAGYEKPRTEAGCQFVDSLSDDHRLQAVSFAGTVIDSTQLLKMDDANKNALKQMISSIDASGITDFNEPLKQAMKTLNKEGRPGVNKAVILLTDGQSWLDDAVVKDYLNSDIKVFTIRINYSSLLGSYDQALVDLANGTGGADTLLMPKDDGSVDAADVLKAFQDAFQSTSGVSVNMREDLIVYAADGISFVQFLIRALVIMLCAAIIGFGYFGLVSVGSSLGSAGMGLIAAGLITMLEGAGFALCGLVVVLLVETAYVFLDLRGEDQFDV